MMKMLKARNNLGINYFGEVTVKTFREKRLRSSISIHNSSTENLFDILYNYLVGNLTDSLDVLIPKYIQVSFEGADRLIKPVYRTSSSISSVDGEKCALLVFSFTRTNFSRIPENSNCIFKLQNSNKMDLAVVTVENYSLGEGETHIIEWRLHFADGGTEEVI